MNNTFETSRFFSLLRKTIFERPVQIIGLVFLNMAIVFGLYFLLRPAIGWDGTQNLTFIWGLIFGGCYLSCILYHYFSSNASGVSYLTLPASAFEKWLTVILVTWIGYIFIFLLFFWSMDAVYVSLYKSGLNPHDPHYVALRDSVQRFDLTGNVAIKTYLMFLACSSAMFVGALYFNKISFIKTSLIICGVLAGVYLLNLSIAHFLYDHVSDAFPFSHVAFDLKRADRSAIMSETLRPMFDEASINLPWSYSSMLNVCKNYFIPVVLVITAYVRLREKEF